jgi:hypothetical protein
MSSYSAARKRAVTFVTVCGDQMKDPGSRPPAPSKGFGAPLHRDSCRTSREAVTQESPARQCREDKVP